MSGKRITFAQIAARAGVSQATVSRVFRPGAPVSEPTIEKVRRAAEELGYRSNVFARAAASGRSRIIGVLAPHLSGPFIPGLLQKASMALQRKGYFVLLYQPSRKLRNNDSGIARILDYRADGMVALSMNVSPEWSKRCAAAGVPVVLLNYVQNNPGLSSVASDNHAGGRRVAEFLAAGGHERIGYIAGWEWPTAQEDREAGFRDGLAASGLKLHCREARNSVRQRARDAVRDMFSNDPPDAVFVVNDHMAFAVMDELRHGLNLRVPEDVSVVGYDDVPAASWPAYNLTTVRLPLDRMVASAVEILLEQIEGDAGPRRVTFDGSLVLRGSARVPEKWNP